MGVSSLVDYDKFPEQGYFLGREVEVCFNYDTVRTLSGIVVRDDAEGEGTMIIQLEDGRCVLSTECMYHLT